MKSRSKITINEKGSDLEIILQPSCNLVIGFPQIIMFIGFSFSFISVIKSVSLKSLIAFDEITLFYILFIGGTFLGALNRFKLIYIIFFKVESLSMNDEVVKISKNNLFRPYEIQLKLADIEKFTISNFADLKEPDSQVQFLNYSDLNFHLKNKKIQIFEFKDFNILFRIAKVLKSRGLRFDGKISG